jgi:hypothetical protein
MSKAGTDTTMELLLNRFASLGLGDFDTVLHIGAGSGIELDGYRSINIRRLVLVEGDPETAEELRAHPALPSDAEAIEQVLAPETGVAEWHRYNLPVLNGVLPPAELLSLYPRLKVLSRERVQALSLGELLKRVDAESTGRNLLFLDVPGLEVILLAPASEPLLEAYEWIVVRGCRGTYYEGGAAIDVVQDRMRQHCYRVDLHDGDTNPDWPTLLFRRDEPLRENRRLQAVLAEHAQKLSEVQHRLSRYESELAEVKTAREAQATLANERQMQVERLTAELKALSDKAEEVHRERAEQSAAQNALQAELVAARRSAALAIKLQALREADLTDLQNKYRTAVATQAAQHELLKKVAGRLTVAADYFRQIHQDETARAKLWELDEENPAVDGRADSRDPGGTAARHLARSE